MPADDWQLSQGTVDFREEERRHRNRGPEKITQPPLYINLTLRCPTCGRGADMCFDHGDDWKKRTRRPT